MGHVTGLLRTLRTFPELFPFTKVAEDAVMSRLTMCYLPGWPGGPLRQRPVSFALMFPPRAATGAYGMLLYSATHVAPESIHTPLDRIHLSLPGTGQCYQEHFL